MSLIWPRSLTWRVLLWMALGLAVGLGIQRGTHAPATAGVRLAEADAGSSGPLRVVTARGPAAQAGLRVGERLTAVVLHPEDVERRERVPLASAEDLRAALQRAQVGDHALLERADAEPVAVTLELDRRSARARLLSPLEFLADVFMALLKMLIVPLVFTSIVVGVSGLGGGRELGRLGAKAFAYYISTSLLAILVGQALVSLVRPGAGADLGLPEVSGASFADQPSVLGILKGMVPQNVLAAMTDNGAMLQMIFFALVFGFAITRAAEPHGTRVRQVFESLLAVVMELARWILLLIPFGVFALMARVVATTGFGVFKPLLLYMGVVAGALVLHSTITLPLLLRFVGGLSPVRWFKAMAPALATAFSTSSSSMTLPVTLETVEQRGGVSNKLASFTLPMGATINMDGTALYECIGVIFLAQYYAGLDPSYTLTLADQGLVVLLALLASIGAAGIPSAGLVMMITILSALDLPVEGAALLLAVDRPLDMLRTTVNVWSDTCGAAIIARSEGEQGPLTAPHEVALPSPAAEL